MTHYDVSSRGDAGSWSDAKLTFNTAEKYSKAFLAVVGSGACDPDGVDTNLAKLQAVWGEMKTLYTKLDQSYKDALHDASIEGTDPINKFAALYNYIYWKYDTSVGTNFINRSITPLSSVTRYTPVITDTDTTKNVVVAVSIGVVSISLLGLYFFIKKRKEDR